jgi:hypothetical protein
VLVYRVDDPWQLRMAQGLAAGDDEEQRLLFLEPRAQVVDEVDPFIRGQFSRSRLPAAIASAVQAVEVAPLGYFQKEISQWVYGGFQVAVDRVGRSAKSAKKARFGQGSIQGRGELHDSLLERVVEQHRLGGVLAVFRAVDVLENEAFAGVVVRIPEFEMTVPGH